jgi:hypothetical protein
MPSTPNPYENFSTPSLNSNSVQFVPGISDVRYPSFGDVSGNNTISELVTPVNISSTNLSSTDTNYTNHGTIDNFSLRNFSTESRYTNFTNHASVGSNDHNLPYIDINLNGIRRNDDLNLFEFRNITDSDVDLNYRRERITNVLNNHYIDNPVNSNDINIDVTNNIINTEMDINKEGVLGNIKLGFKYLNSKVNYELAKLDSMYIKYHDISRRHFY